MILQIEPWIDNAELKQLKKVVSSTFVTEAELTKEFETIIKDLTGSKHAISMTNGTAALFCCLKALGIGEGDEVIVPDMTFIATANAVIMAGARPVLCDVYYDTLCLDIELAEKLITTRTKAIIPVHLYGQSSDMNKVIELSKSKNIFVIEDAAQGVGVRFMDKHVGTFGDLGILSFYGNKTITCGEGGVVLTDSDELAKSCYRLKNHGRDKKGVFIHDHIGYNFAFTEMQAAIGIAQMKKLNDIIIRKKEINDIYIKNFEGLDEFEKLNIDKRCKHLYWFTSFYAKKINKLIDHLNKKSIQTRRFFYPLHLQPCYDNTNKIINNNCPISKGAYDNGISLPSSYTLKKEDQFKVIEEIRSFYS